MTKLKVIYNSIVSQLITRLNLIIQRIIGQRFSIFQQFFFGPEHKYATAFKLHHLNKS